MSTASLGLLPKKNCRLTFLLNHITPLLSKALHVFFSLRASTPCYSDSFLRLRPASQSVGDSVISAICGFHPDRMIVIFNCF